MTTFAELLAQAEAQERTQRKLRKRRHDEEHHIQSVCVQWFRLTHPALSKCLFAVPNGGRRDASTGAKLKEEGALAGVADLILLVPRGPYGALLIEMKTPKGRQSDEQKAWQKAVEKQGYCYILCRSLDEFQTKIEQYLAQN